MTFDEQAATLKRKDIVALLASHQQLTATCAELAARNEGLARQLEWFKRQLFGTKSERRLIDPGGRHLALGEWAQAEAGPGAEITVAEHRRRSRIARSDEPETEEPLRFDESVPVEEMRLPHPPFDDEHEIVSEKTTLRLAQRPASYVVLKYIRPVVKRKTNGPLSCPPPPVASKRHSLHEGNSRAGWPVAVPEAGIEPERLLREGDFRKVGKGQGVNGF